MGPMKIQPIDIESERAAVVRNESVLKWRLRRLFVFERNNKDGGGAELEAGSVNLAKMVQNFMEDQPAAVKCGRNRCNCFNANSSEEEELDLFGGAPPTGESIPDAAESLKSLIPCASVGERNLLAEVARIVEKNGKCHKGKEELRKMVADSLISLGYDSSICKSKWEKTTSSPSGEYEFIDAIVEGELLIVDVDFRSEFEIARSTGTYKAILNSLPYIFVGTPQRLRQIVTLVSQAAKHSLNKKAMHVPPWRKTDYMLAKWLSPSAARPKQPPSETDCAQLDLIFRDPQNSLVATPAWQPPPVKPKRGAKVVTGLASLLKDKP